MRKGRIGECDLGSSLLTPSLSGRRHRPLHHRHVGHAHLSALAANARKDTHPSFLVTGGGLYKDPQPQFFALAIMKAAQVNLAASLAKEYGPNGVHVGTVAVGGHVSPDSDVFSPAKIAESFWKLYRQDRDRWELMIHIGC